MNNDGVDKMDTTFNNEHAVMDKKDSVENQVDSIRLYVGFWMRFWGYLLDLIVIGSLNRMLIGPIMAYFDLSMIKIGFISLSTILSAIVMYIYLVIMTKKYGQTLGKMILGIKVAGKDGEPLSWSTVIFREVIGKFISKTVLFIGFITVAFTEKKQGWHDMIADTVVIYEKRV